MVFIEFSDYIALIHLLNELSDEIKFSHHPNDTKIAAIIVVHI